MNNTNNVNIRKATMDESKKISMLHKDNINKGFLSLLGEKFLTLLYISLIKSENSVCIVAEKNNEIIGFVAFSHNIKKTYKEFILRYFFNILFIIFLKMFNFKIMKMIFETLLYPVKESLSLPESELLSIAVKKEFQGMGISKKLFDFMVSYAKKKNIKSFKVIVGEKLIQAKRFYEKCGGVKVGEINIHGKEKSYIYVWNL